MQIDKICRACLREDDKMIDMFEKGIYQTFLLFANLTVGEEIPAIPFNLCQSCEQTLNISLSFRDACQKSHEILLNYVKNTCVVESEIKLEATYVDFNEFYSEATDLNDTSEVQLEEVHEVESETTDVEEVELEETHVDAYEDDLETTGVKNTSKGADANPNKRSRLKLFSHHQVQKATNDLKHKFYENTNCIRCGYVGSNLRSLSRHIIRLHKDLQPRWCYTCNGEFDNLAEHAKSHDDDFNCKFCNRNFQNLRKLIDHVPYHSDVKTFQCWFCEKGFDRRNHLNVHLVKIHQQVCESEGDADKQPLLVHAEQVRSMCDKDGYYSCTVCKMRFRTAAVLEGHMPMHSTETPYKCKYCVKKFKEQKDMIKHEYTHTVERPYVCQVCEKGFKQKYTLKHHMMIHNIGNKISCNICDKKFNRKMQLRLHLRWHTGETPYACTECGKAFVGRNYLLQHHKTHSNLRPYKCSECNQTFKHRSMLKHHTWIHSGEKPYKCNQCSYACRDGSNLSKHMRQHATDKPQADRPHVCLMCNRNFTTNAMLTTHVNAHNVNFLEI